MRRYRHRYRYIASGNRIGQCLKSEKGGISGIIYEIIITAVLLSLLLVVIGLFRKNMDIIRSSAEKTFEVEKTYADTEPDLQASQVTGLDVISTIRYYSSDKSDSSVAITVRSGAAIMTYVNQTYDSKQFPIDYRDIFDYNCEYDGAKLIKIDFQKIN